MPSMGPAAIPREPQQRLCVCALCAAGIIAHNGVVQQAGGCAAGIQRVAGEVAVNTVSPHERTPRAEQQQQK